MMAAAWSYPPDFAGQARLVWRHLGTLLAAADMSYDDLVSLRFFATGARVAGRDRGDRSQGRLIGPRRRVLRTRASS